MITQPAEDAVLGDTSFTGCAELIDKDGFLIVGNVLYGYYGINAHVVVPPGVKKIGQKAFFEYAYDFLKSVILPDGLEEIGREAFYYCHNLTPVFIPDTVVRIGEFAFFHCSSLTNNSLPKRVKRIEDGAFLECERLADENGFIIIDGILFEYIGGLTEVVVPDGVTRIGIFAFHDNDELLRVTLPESVKSIGRGAFKSCGNLKCVDLPKGEISIEKDAFLQCDRLIKPKQK